MLFFSTNTFLDDKSRDKQKFRTKSYVFSLLLMNFRLQQLNVSANLKLLYGRTTINVFW